MKKLALILLVFLPFFSNGQETYGKTANIGLGIGYRNAFRASLPILHFNYEFDVAKNFTLAPFVTLIHYRYHYDWKGTRYRYNAWTIPVGLRGSYYFDELFNLDSKFDIYGGGSVGFTIYNGRWDDDKYDGPDYDGGYSQLYLDLHVGAEYHIKENLGLFVDFSTGISTIGLAIHK